jgi:hypothetical protein
MDKNTIDKIKSLKYKIEAGTASQSEKDEYVEILHQNKKLYDSLYESYKKTRSFYYFVIIKELQTFAMPAILTTN